MLTSTRNKCFIWSYVIVCLKSFEDNPFFHLISKVWKIILSFIEQIWNRMCRYSLSYVLDIQYILSKLFSDLYLNSELPRTQNIFTFDKWLLGWNWHPIVRLSYTPAHSSSLPCFLSLTIHTHTHTLTFYWKNHVCLSTMLLK